MAQGKAESDNTVEESPYAEIKRRLSRFRFAALLAIVIFVGMFFGSVAVVVDSGLKSMSAFEDLPKYQVNTIVLGYRKAVKAFDTSLVATQSALDSEKAQRTLDKSRHLVEQSLKSEQAFDQILAAYGEAMGLAAEQVGGALEWNRYFQADIQALREKSAQRQSQFEAIFGAFPEPNLPAEEAPVTNSQ